MAEDRLSAVRYTLAEMLGHKKEGYNIDNVIATIPGAVITDSKNVYDALLRNAAFLGRKEKMEGRDLRAYRERCTKRLTSTRRVHGDANLANSLTKKDEMHQLNTFFERGYQY